MTDFVNRVPGRRGRHSESHEPSLRIERFLKVAANVTTPEWDGTHGWANWDMDCNGPDPLNPPAYPNGLGDCGAAAIDHLLAAQAGDPSLLGTMGGNPKAQPGITPVVAAYFAYGVAQGEQGQPPAPASEPDQGVDNAKWLAWLYKAGIIDGYAEVPAARAAYYASGFGGALLGVLLSDDAEQEFANVQPWGEAGDNADPSMGHDVALIQSHADGSGAVVTWGAVQPFLPEFVRNIQDAWVIISKDDPTVDWPTLQTALDALHGAVGGFTAPAPTGTPTPDPIDDFEDKVKHLIADVRAIVQRDGKTAALTFIKDALPTIAHEVVEAITKAI